MKGRYGSERASALELKSVGAAWNRVFVWYLLYIAVGLVLAFVLPESLAPSSSFKLLVDAMARVIPSIDRLARVSFSPEFTRAYGAVMWLLQPLFTIVALMCAPRMPIRRMQWSTLTAMFLGALLAVFIGILFPFFFQDISPNYLSYSKGRGVAGLTFIATSRLGHGTLGSVMFAFSSISQVMVWRFVRDCPRQLAYNIRLRTEKRNAQ